MNWTAEFQLQRQQFGTDKLRMEIAENRRHAQLEDGVKAELNVE